MANRGGLWKFLWYWIVWVLSIWWITYTVTQDDVRDQYRANTWKELVVDESDFVTPEEQIEDLNQILEYFKLDFDHEDCKEVGSDRDALYEKYFMWEWGALFTKKVTCDKLVDVFADGYSATKMALRCEETQLNNNDLEKSDIEYCVKAWQKVRDADTAFYTTLYAECSEACEKDITADEYNIAFYQSFLKQL